MLTCVGLVTFFAYAPVLVSTSNAFTILQDVHDTTLAARAHTQDALGANTQEFDVALDDHLLKILGQEGVPQA